MKKVVSTLKKVRSLSLRIFVTALILFSFARISYSQILYSEGFTVVSPLPAGWAAQNLSSPVGGTGWEQGFGSADFSAQSGPPSSYISADYFNVDSVGTISNWLFMPTVTMNNGDVFTFYTRRKDVPFYPDRLQVRLSTSGASTNAGATATSVGDFTTLLLDINPLYTYTGYPVVWTLYTITISGLPGPTSGRLAFRYFVENGGFGGSNAEYIGIDNVVYSGPSLLPVTYLNFSGYKQGSVNIIKWTTVNESNNLGFEVLRSNDGNNYSVIGFVNTLAPGGNSNDILNYRFIDNNPGSKQNYRIRQVDIDGRSKFSTVVLIRGEKPMRLSIGGVFPNPTDSRVNVIIETPVRNEVTLVVTDITGRILIRKLAGVETGSNTISIDVSGLSKGSYFLKLVCIENCEAVVTKFIKQ